MYINVGHVLTQLSLLIIMIMYEHEVAVSLIVLAVFSGVYSKRVCFRVSNHCSESD